MIEEIDYALKNWIATILDDHYQISFKAPGESPTQPTLTIYLYGMENGSTLSSVRNISFQVTLLYLVTVQSSDPIEDHEVLGKLLFAAKSKSDLEVHCPMLPTDFWLALGAPPMPHFCIRHPLIVPRATKVTPKVKSQPQINLNSIATVEGFLYGPDRQPISGAKVISSKTRSVAFTDRSGKFIVSKKTSETNEFLCQVDAKGQSFQISVPLHEAKPNTPIIIQLDSLEV